MTGWLLRRGLQAVATFAAVTILLFVVMRLTPGDPLAELTAEKPVTAAQTAALRQRYGIDQPIGRQLTAFLAGAWRGDLGPSIKYGRPVVHLIAERLPASFLLGGAALLLNFTLGTWLGVVQAVRRGSWIDRTLTVLALAAYAMPSFWLGIMLANQVGIEWRLLPPAAMRDPYLAGAGPLVQALDVLRHLVLPAVTLSVVSIAVTMRYQRTALLEVFRLDYVRTARAKGLSERRVIWRHAWRTAVFPILTLLGLWIPILVTGSVFVEAVFSWPGLGALATEAIGGRDYPLILGTTMLVSALVILGNLAADLGYYLLDPRVRRP